MRVAAIIAAAGRGERIGGPVNKQFVEIGGKPLLTYALEKFEACSTVAEVVVVVPSDWLLFTSQEIVDKYQIQKVIRVLAGGKERQDSVFAGLKALQGDADTVAIHDGVRPLIKPEVIAQAVQLANESGAAILAVPPKDTIKEGKDGRVVRTLERSQVWVVQTPQVFKFDLIWEAYQKAFADGVYSTDDSALVERIGGEVKILEGDYSNFKITSAEDLELARLLLERQEGR